MKKNIENGGQISNIQLGDFNQADDQALPRVLVVATFCSISFRD